MQIDPNAGPRQVIAHAIESAQKAMSYMVVAEFSDDPAEVRVGIRHAAEMYEGSPMLADGEIGQKLRRLATQWQTPLPEQIAEAARSTRQSYYATLKVYERMRVEFGL
jgi:hypothetical protein